MLIKLLKHKVTVFFVLFICINFSIADNKNLEFLWELHGLDNPESVIYDSKLKHLYVSNVNGQPNDKDGNGYISIISLDGKIINKKWMVGLNAPKGLALFGRNLYIADIDELVVIDIDYGRIVKKYKVDDAKFLNDVAAAPNGDIYVSDMLTNRIHRLTKNTFSVWVESDDLESPNGLFVLGDDLIVGAWGAMTEGFSTDIPGHLKRISIQDKTISSIGDGSPIGNLDGVEAADQEGFYVTDWMNGKLFYISNTGGVSTLLTLVQGSADLEFIVKKGLIFIPMMNDNKILAYKVNDGGRSKD